MLQIRVWRYQRDNQNPQIEEEQTTQWPKEKVQKDKQRSTKHTNKPKNLVTRTPLKTAGNSGAQNYVKLSCRFEMRSLYQQLNINDIDFLREKKNCTRVYKRQSKPNVAI